MNLLKHVIIKRAFVFCKLIYFFFMLNIYIYLGSLKDNEISLFSDPMSEKDLDIINKDFKPTFFDDLKNLISLSDLQKCNNSRACIFDSLVSGSDQMGNDTRVLTEKSSRKKSENSKYLKFLK
jgi:hypothetical protein